MSVSLFKATHENHNSPWLVVGPDGYVWASITDGVSPGGLSAQDRVACVITSLNQAAENGLLEAVASIKKRDAK